MQHNLEQVLPRKKKIVVAKKMKKQVGGIVSADRGKTTIVMMCMSASICHRPWLSFGHDSPNKVIFLKTVRSMESGYKTTTTFNKWFEHFLEHVWPTEANPVLLIVDGQSSHTNLSFAEISRDKNVTVLIFPPHCSHRLQPLAVTFMEPFETYFEAVVDDLRTDIQHMVKRIVLDVYVGIREAYIALGILTIS